MMFIFTLVILGVLFSYSCIVACRTLEAQRRAHERAFAFQLPPRRRLTSEAVEFRPRMPAQARRPRPEPMWDHWLDG